MSIFKLIKEEDNIIIITPSKKELLKYMSENKIIKNIKFYTLDEIKDNLDYKYRNDTLYYISNKYNIILENSKIIMDNLYYIDIDNSYSNDKLNYLKKIKLDLIDNGYIIFNHLFKNNFNSKKIYIYNYLYINKYYQKLLNNNYELINDNYDKDTPIIINEFNTLEDEIVWCASEIVNLINNGIDINNIKINLLDNDYTSTIKRIFKLFNIPINLNIKHPLCSYDQSKYFVDLLNDDFSLEESILTIRENYKISSSNQNIFNSIINFVNTYNLLNLDKETILKLYKYYSENNYISIKNYTNIVNSVDITNYLVNDNDYVFILGLNQDILPKTISDSDYLNDLEKDILNIENSIEINQINKNILLNKIYSIKNLFISYKLKSAFNKYSPSSIINEINSKINYPKYKYTNENYNNYLLSKNLDNYIKYKENSDELENLYYENNKYNSYDNAYKNISSKKLYNYLDEHLNISYSSLETFYKCPFRYYLENVLKINKYEEDSVSIIVGNLVHYILSVGLDKSDSEIINLIDDYLNNLELKKDNKQYFYINKYKKEILKLIAIIKEQSSRSSFNKAYYEEKFIIEKDKEIKVTIKGFIDKIMVLEDNDNTYVIVIDYKTGTIHSDFNYVIYGMNMQLLIYLYLIKNSNKFSNVKVAGMYWQNIIKDLLPASKDKNYNSILFDSYRLDGYTLEDINILELIDNNYLNGSYLKTIKTKKDGSFYNYSKVLSYDDINKLLDIVENNIDSSITKILNSDFSISPKRIGNEMLNDITGCRYCKNYDICYKKNSDIINLKEIKDLEYIRGEEV